MLYHGEKCRHCRGNMSQPKLITDGPRKGGYRTICINCGHFEYKDAPQSQSQSNPAQTKSSMPTAHAQSKLPNVGPPKKPVIFTGS